MSTLGERMRKLRELKGLSQAELGRFLGYSSQTISQYELNKRNPDLEAVQKTADFFNVTTDYLTGSKNYTIRLLSTEDLSILMQNTPRRIPVLKPIPADLTSDLNPTDTLYIDIPKEFEGEYKAIIAKDDSMSPLILPGDTVIFKIQSTAVTNDIVLVSINENEAVIRKLVRRNNRVSLVPLNGNHETLVFDKTTFARKQILGIIAETRHTILKGKK